jgi:hypothetical protein
MPPYSFLRHLGKAVLFGEFKDSLSMAMFSAYFDTSGTKRSAVLTSVGFVSRVKKWDRFTDEWTAILNRYGVKLMRMSEFASSRGEFADWRGQSERRRLFISELSNCIGRNTNKGFASSVIIAEYESLDKDFMLNEHVGPPFVLAMRSCFGGLFKWARNKGVKPDQTLILVEKGDDDYGPLENAARADGYKVIPLLKTDTVAFQAADLAAWKINTTIKNAAHGPLRDTEDARRILESMNPIRPLVQRNAAYSREALIHLIGLAKIPRRSAKISA